MMWEGGISRHDVNMAMIYLQLYLEYSFEVKAILYLHGKSCLEINYLSNFQESIRISLELAPHCIINQYAPIHFFCFVFQLIGLGYHQI